MGNFINDLIAEVNNLPLSKNRLFILGDLNIDQRSTPNPLVRVTDQLNLIQLSSFSTHSSGSILDIILANSPAVMGFLPAYFSDHSILFMQL